MNILWGVVAGLVVGVFAGLFGVGGGIIAIPFLVYAFKMDQHTAQGTSLAMMLPPTGLLAFLEYYREGHADLKLGLLLAAGVFVGGWLGAHWADAISGTMLRKVFAVVMIATAIKMFFEK